MEKKDNNTKKQEAKPAQDAKNSEKTSNEVKSDPKDVRIAELTHMLQRLQADFENYKKRIDREKSDYATYLNVSLIKKLLPLVDNFDIALKNTESKDEFIKGMDLIYVQFIDMLKNENVERIESVGKPFDPHNHQALMAEDKKGTKSNIVIEEFQAGYKLKDRVIRPAKVKISK